MHTTISPTPPAGSTRAVSSGAEAAGQPAVESDLRPGAAKPARGLGWMLLLEAALAFAPLVVLGPAIGWPASLGQPASVQLPAIAAAPAAVAAGYGLYLLYSVLVAPVLIGLALRTFDGLHGLVAASVAAFAALSVLARSIGILRWLTVMPELAGARAAAGPAEAQAIDRLFEAINGLAGGVGELLGVSLFAALALGSLCAGGWQRRSMPWPLAASGLLVAALLAALFLPALGLAIAPPVAVAVTALSLWMAFAGIWCLRSAGVGRSSLPAA